ncbi:hypothetical protein ACP4OV_003889 [Aristida adscensionis]
MEAASDRSTAATSDRSTAPTGDRSTAATGSGMDAALVAIESEQLPVGGANIDDPTRDSTACNLQDVDEAVLASTLPQEPSFHEPQIFVRTCNRTVVLNVNLRCDSVEDVKRLIEGREGIPTTEQHLIFGAKPLRQGTFLRDYDALGDQSTIHVSQRVRAGNGRQEMTLKELVDTVAPPGQRLPPAEEKTKGRPPFTELAEIPRQRPPVMVPVLSGLGRRILHGVLTCVLSAHRAGMAYNGACGMGNFRVRVHYTQGGATTMEVSRVYIQPPPPPPFDDDAGEKEDYQALRGVIESLLPLTTLHAGRIHQLLGSLASGIPASTPSFRARRTQLLQAHAATVSSPVAVSTMCLNLRRFYHQLDSEHQFTFVQAMQTAQASTVPPLPDQVKKQTLFQDTHKFKKNALKNNAANEGTVPDNQYAGDITGTELFNFARNWFTHVPPKRWTRHQHHATEEFTGLPHLDYIFTYHFPNFMPRALLELYKNFHDHNLLTEMCVALVPLA